MLHNRVRHIDAFPSRPAGAQPQVGVLAIEEKGFIEEPDFIEHLALVHGGASARQESVFSASEVLGRLQVPALFTAAVAADEHARRIESAVFARENHL